MFACWRLEENQKEVEGIIQGNGIGIGIDEYAANIRPALDNA